MNLTPDDYKRLLTAGGKTVRLKTKAKTVWTKSPGKPVEEHTVALVEDPRYFKTQGLSLVIEGTPGRWPLGSLWEHGIRRHSLMIDAGQGWEWINTQQVYMEADKLVTPRQGYQFK